MCVCVCMRVYACLCVCVGMCVCAVCCGLHQVEMDITRISYRNLGRDDRCISDHGLESRYPFLDEDLVTFLNSLRMDEKVDFSLPRGFGEKKLLRDAARRIGLQSSAELPKRAIQFGSRIAKIDSGKTKGSDDMETPTR
eukprot:m.811524 g.811524  ORF g.811524 m.811524 type:complete len:139 (-) comp23390_c0_seq7:1005-1421(-)